jgi:DNA-binding NtrC family response regulator
MAKCRPDGAIMNKNKTVILADPDKTSRELLVKTLTEAGYRTFPATNGLDAIKNIREYDPVAVIMQAHLPCINGVEPLTVIHSINESLPVIILSLDSSVDTEIRFREAGAFCYLLMPVQDEYLFKFIEAAVKTGIKNRI